MPGAAQSSAISATGPLIPCDSYAEKNKINQISNCPSNCGRNRSACSFLLKKTVPKRSAFHMKYRSLTLIHNYFDAHFLSVQQGFDCIYFRMYYTSYIMSLRSLPNHSMILKMPQPFHVLLLG